MFGREKKYPKNVSDAPVNKLPTEANLPPMPGSETDLYEQIEAAADEAYKSGLTETRAARWEEKALGRKDEAA